MSTSIIGYIELKEVLSTPSQTSLWTHKSDQFELSEWHFWNEGTWFIELKDRAGGFTVTGKGATDEEATRDFFSNAQRLLGILGPMFRGVLDIQVLPISVEEKKT